MKTHSVRRIDVAINGRVGGLDGHAGRGERDALENGKDTLDSWKTRGESICFSESELSNAVRDEIRCMPDSAFYAACAAINPRTQPPPSSPRFAPLLASVLSLSTRTRAHWPADPMCLQRECTSHRYGLARTCTRPHPSEAISQISTPTPNRLATPGRCGSWLAKGQDGTTREQPERRGDRVHARLAVHSMGNPVAKTERKGS
jgi:hypothetical protein